jgi:hypothetical protein
LMLTDSARRASNAAVSTVTRTACEAVCCGSDTARHHFNPHHAEQRADLRFR